MFKKILVPLDGSENAEKVIPFVITEAQKHNARIIIIRVIPPLRPAIMSIPAVVERVDQDIEGIVRAYLDKIINSLRTQGLKVEAAIEKGNPAECILRYAEITGCDLIVIGTYGYTRATRWRTGSVAINIIRAQIDIPILLVPT
jgi:nucleotide-binding universal stress UspA family protein